MRDYAIVALDPDGNVLTWNAGAERIKGYKSQEIIGKHFSCFYPDEKIQSGVPAQLLLKTAEEGRLEDELARPQRRFPVLGQCGYHGATRQGWQPYRFRKSHAGPDGAQRGRGNNSAAGTGTPGG